MLKAGAIVVATGALLIIAGFWTGYTFSGSSGQVGILAITSGSRAGGPAPVSKLSPVPNARPHPSFAPLQQTITGLLASAGASGGVTLVELGGSTPQTWSLAGDQQFVAASTYKLPLLMEEAQDVTAGRSRASDSLCYQDDDWEDGWYSDYSDGVCMSRSELERRVGQDSDNTAAHILVRYDGGGGVLNRYARAHGARSSAFYDPNTTTTNDLAQLLVDEHAGRAGGRSAQQFLYPLLTHTSFEDGIPAGVPQRVTVVHKIGNLDTETNDAALVENGPSGSYVLAVCTAGLGGAAGWKLLADISAAVWRFEGTR